MTQDHLSTTAVCLFTGVLSSYVFLQQNSFLTDRNRKYGRLTSDSLKHLSKDRVGNISTNSISSLVHSKANGIPRVESEFSLGLNRSDSINEHLMEYGELCAGGQIAISILKYTATLVASSAVLFYYIRKDE